MSGDGDESHILARALEWLQIDHNRQQDGPLKQITLPTQRQTMLHRAIAEVQPKVIRVWLKKLSTRFCFLHEVRKFPITETTILDLYHGRKTRLNIVDQACCGIDSTFCVLNIVPIKFDNLCWLAVIVLFSEPNHFVCLSEINLTNSELIVHQMENLNLEEQTNAAVPSFLCPNWNTDMLVNNMSLFLNIVIRISPMFRGKQIDLKYSSSKTRIPTMSIQNGPLYSYSDFDFYDWCIVDQTIYGFGLIPETSRKSNELIVANWETFPPYDIKHVETRKISGFSKYENGKELSSVWQNNAYYSLQRKNSIFEVIFFTLESLVWGSIIKFEHNLFKHCIYIAVEENELVLSFTENHNSLSNNAQVYNCMIFPISRPLSLSKLSLFAVYHFNHKDPKYGKMLELIQLQASLKPLPNSTKLQSIQDEEFQNFCAS